MTSQQISRTIRTVYEYRKGKYLVVFILHDETVCKKIALFGTDCSVSKRKGKFVEIARYKRVIYLDKTIFLDSAAVKQISSCGSAGLDGRSFHSSA
jgi:pyruvate carboxylase